MKKFLLLSIQFLICLSFSAHAGDEPGATPAEPAQSELITEGCEAMLKNIKLRGLSVNEVVAGATSHKISEVMELAKTHPSILMNADQTIWAAIRRGGSREIMNPHYRAEKIIVWDTFSKGVKEADGRRIIGQYDVIQQFVDWIRGRAEGRTDSGMLVLVGPGGTGKTFFANISTTIIESLNRDNPDFYRYTYQWTSEIGKLPGLEELVDASGRVNLPPTKRSPITLFPVTLQEKIYMNGYKAGRNLLGGIDPLPKVGPHVQTEVILHAIIQKAAQDTKKSIAEIMNDEKLYHAALDPYVRIVRVFSSTNAVSPVVRYPGNKLPDLETLYGGKDIVRHLTFKNGHPFSYNYNGAITGRDGGMLAIDELFRWPEDTLNFKLELAENNVIQISGMPPLKVDVVTIAATNDESVEKAKDNGTIKAFTDRSTLYPMRYSLHPVEIAETALVMLTKDNLSLLSMRKLNGAGQPVGEVEPFEYAKVFPQPEEDGILKGSDDRYAVYIRNGADEPMLIAPRTLTMLGMIAGATHMVTDPSKLEAHKDEMDTLSTRDGYFSDIAIRMKLLIGDLRAEHDSAIRLELSRWQKIGKEGSSGISNRDTQKWLSRALSDARNAKETSLTPYRLDEAFRKMLDENGFTESGTITKSEWIKRTQLIRSQIILPYLKADVMNIMQGGTGEAERLYDDVKGEILARNMNRDAKEWQRGGERVAIRVERLNNINQIYTRMFQKALMPNAIANYHATTTDGTRDPELLEAVKSFLLKKEYDVSIFGEVRAYFEGNHVTQKAREAGQAAEKALVSLGYDRMSFLQAISYVEKKEATEETK